MISEKAQGEFAEFLEPWYGRNAEVGQHFASAFREVSKRKDSEGFAEFAEDLLFTLLSKMGASEEPRGGTPRRLASDAVDGQGGLFELMDAAWIDWPAVSAIVGVASVFAGSWLQDKREARAEAEKHDRITDCERRCEMLEEQFGHLLEVVEKIGAKR